MIKYPDFFPLPLVSKRANRAFDTILRTQMTSGRARQRRVFESAPEIATVTLLFTSNPQCLAFELWFRDAIKATEWFEINLRYPDGLLPRVARFTSTYSGPDPMGFSQWVVNAELELRELHIADYPNDLGLFPEYVLDVNIFDVAMNRYWPEA